MALTDWQYLIFLIVVVGTYYNLPNSTRRTRWLLLAGYVFCLLVSSVSLIVLVFVQCVTRCVGWMLSSPRRPEPSGFVLTAGIALLLAPLFFFKYLAAALHLFNQADSVWIPIGISFYTFQAIGYLIDVYLGVGVKAPGAARVALFLGFFPILSAGPIERADRLIPQFERCSAFDAAKAFDGVRLIVLGLFLKLVFADQLGAEVDAVYQSLATAGRAERLLAMLAFPFQLYADIAGYTMIAMGSARILGIEVMPNFRQPFLAPNIQEFWRRWHISLSSWFRTYLYMPLCLEWRSLGRYAPPLAVLVTFIIVGIWHGAGLKFAIYGLSQGCMLAVSILTLDYRNRFFRRRGLGTAVLMPVRVTITFLMVATSLVFVRAASIADAGHVLSSLFPLTNLLQVKVNAANPFTATVSLAAVGLLGLDMLQQRGLKWEMLPRSIQAAVLGCASAAVLLCWVLNNAPPVFIYYKF